MRVIAELTTKAVVRRFEFNFNELRWFLNAIYQYYAKKGGLTYGAYETDMADLETFR